ncbi:MAG: hypothetical protein AABW65_01780 [Nanoarchaeota archaeon]
MKNPYLKISAALAGLTLTYFIVEEINLQNAISTARSIADYVSLQHAISADSSPINPRIHTYPINIDSVQYVVILAQPTDKSPLELHLETGVNKEKATRYIDLGADGLLDSVEELTLAKLTPRSDGGSIMEYSSKFIPMKKEYTKSYHSELLKIKRVLKKMQSLQTTNTNSRARYI